MTGRLRLTPISDRLTSRAHRAAEAFARRLDNMAWGKLRPFCLDQVAPVIGFQIGLSFGIDGSFASVRVVPVAASSVAEDRRVNLLDLKGVAQRVESLIYRDVAEASLRRRYEGRRPFAAVEDGPLLQMALHAAPAPALLEVTDAARLTEDLRAYFTGLHARQEAEMRASETADERTQRLTSGEAAEAASAADEEAQVVE